MIEPAMVNIKKVIGEPYYKVNTMYAITINLIDKYQYHNNINRFQKVRNLLHETFMGWPGDYELHIECSEPRGMHTQGRTGPRLHAHGTIQFKTNKHIARFLLINYYKLLRIASVDIDTISDLSVWKKYCTKQHIWKNTRISNYQDD